MLVEISHITVANIPLYVITHISQETIVIRGIVMSTTNSYT